MSLLGKKRVFDSTEKIQGVHSFGIDGKSIICPHCGNNRFEKGLAMLNTAWLTFFNLDWANKQAAILTCVNCTNIQWFLKEPVATD